MQIAFMSFLCIFMHDIDAQQQAFPEGVKWRSILMHHFFERIKPEVIRNISNGSQNVCIWDGITCEGQEIRKVKYNRFLQGNFMIRFLPATVAVLSITFCTQNGETDTRKYPRNALVIDLSNNNYRGKLNLTTLPCNLEEGHFQNNHFGGPICFTELPKNLRILDISTNWIWQDIVLYDRLPASVEEICLLKPSDPKRSNPYLRNIL